MAQSKLEGAALSPSPPPGTKFSAVDSEHQLQIILTQSLPDRMPSTESDTVQPPSSAPVAPMKSPPPKRSQHITARPDTDYNDKFSYCINT
ncbi:hypothetical protein EG68_02903 [Paragonimus skrjabini miyazakii]|uniref:Uncharacterized protein n=1 Tax=Paragonimus skrjabini miyazakii TaxID=59628 RepID=A0A8S9Z4G0_9TREM|nr:hypothetical protein EG68_02903 [Paragonimus skrjabini miyazakii]